MVFIILLIGVLYYAFQLPVIQTKAVQFATSYLSKELNSKVQIGKVAITWFDEFKFSDIIIHDLNDREMIKAKEIYINAEGSFQFDKEKIAIFSNSLDYILLSKPYFALVKEEDGSTNLDNWIAKINSLQKNKETSKKTPAAFKISEAIIEDGLFSMADPNQKEFPINQFDYFNFALENLNAELKNIYLRGDTIQFNANKIRAKDNKSGLTINELTTDFLLTKQNLSLDNLYASINQSVIRNKIKFNYKSLADFSDFIEKVDLDVNFNNSILSLQDISLFAPAIHKYKDIIRLDGQLNGSVNQLNLANLKFGFGKESAIKGDFNLVGLPNINELTLAIKLDTALVNVEDLRQYVKLKDYNDYIYKFGKVKANGTFEGKIEDFVADATVQSNKVGSISGKVKIKQGTKISKTQYQGDIYTDNLALGILINEEDLIDKIAFEGKVNGKGLTISDAEVSLKGKVNHIDFQKYRYKDILVDGILGQSVFNGEIDLNDSNLVANIKGQIDFSQVLNKFDIKGMVKKVELKPLGFSDQDILLSSEIDLNVQGNELDNWVGQAQFLNSFIRQNENISEEDEKPEYQEKTLLIDSLYLFSQVDTTNKDRKFKLKSEFLDASINGKFVPSILAKDLTNLIKEYKLFFTGTTEEKEKYYFEKRNNESDEEYKIAYDIDFKESKSLIEFFEPKLYISKEASMAGNINFNSTSQVSIYGLVDTLKYGNNLIVDTEIDINSSKSKMKPEVLSSLILQGENQIIEGVETENLLFNASWGGQNQILFDSYLAQKDSENKGKIFGKIILLEEGYDLIFNPKNSQLNLLGEKWKFPDNNLVYFKDNNICFQNFGLFNLNQFVKIDGNFSNNPEEEAVVQISDFNLTTLNSVFKTDFKGILNGELTVKDIFNSPLIGSELFIDELIYKDILVGTVASKVKWNESLRRLDVNGNINRINNEIFRLVGNYDPKNEESPLDLTAKLRRTNLEIGETFVQDLLSEIKGYATGDLHITGSLKNPLFDGKIEIEKGQFLLNLLGTKVFFDDTIILSEYGFLTSEEGIKLRDGLNSKNIAVIKGGIFNGGENNFNLGLNFAIEDGVPFKVMNTTEEQSGSFFGQAFASGVMNINGPFDDIKVTGSLKSEKGTKVTIPMDNTEMLDPEKEAIPFIGKADLPAENDTSKIFRDEIKLSGVNLDLNLNLTSDAEGKIIVDRRVNDQMEVVGAGKISILYDTRGGFTMSGPYIVRSGTYNFSFQGLGGFRKFTINNGSRIEWSGDPYTAQVGIEAGYTAFVPLKDISSECADGNSARVPVQVIVKINGNMLLPDISYDIVIDQSQVPINCRPYILGFQQNLRNNEQLLTKNIASLLVLNTVFPENDVNAFLRQDLILSNASSIISNQFSDFAKTLDENLDFEFNLGDVTENFNNAQLKLGYTFDRFKVSANSSYSNASIYNTTSISGTNTGQLSLGGNIEYNLNADGSLKIKGYSRSIPYSFNAASGTNISSGISFQFTRDFNKFFKKKEIISNSDIKIKDLPTPKIKKDSTRIISKAFIKPKVETEIKDSTNK